MQPQWSFFSISPGPVVRCFNIPIVSEENQLVNRLIYRQIFVYIGILIVRIISSTYRTKVINPEIELDVLKRGQVPIYASWHQRFFPGITFFAKRKPISIMISQSKDGELISRIVNQLGWHPVRGSSSRGGKKLWEKFTHLRKKGIKLPISWMVQKVHGVLLNPDCL